MLYSLLKRFLNILKIFFFSINIYYIRLVISGSELFSFLMFADDLKLLRKIVTIADCIVLQNKFNNIVSWFNYIQLELNIETPHWGR